MKMDVRAVAITSGLLWGGGVLAVEALNRVSPGYGSGFLKMIASCYPGYKGRRNAKQIALGAGYAVLDGATSGLIFALLYNRLAQSHESERNREHSRVA